MTIDVNRRMNHHHLLDRLADLLIRKGMPDYIRRDNRSEFGPTPRSRNPRGHSMEEFGAVRPGDERDLRPFPGA